MRQVGAFAGAQGVDVGEFDLENAFVEIENCAECLICVKGATFWASRVRKLSTSLAEGLWGVGY